VLAGLRRWLGGFFFVVTLCAMKYRFICVKKKKKEKEKMTN